MSAIENLKPEVRAALLFALWHHQHQQPGRPADPRDAGHREVHLGHGRGHAEGARQVSATGMGTDKPRDTNATHGAPGMYAADPQWKLVPVKLTTEMHCAACNAAFSTPTDQWPQAVHDAMLAAAPQPAQEPDCWAAEDAECSECGYVIGNASTCNSMCKGGRALIDALRAQVKSTQEANRTLVPRARLPQPAPESFRDHAVYAMAARAEITREQVEGLPRKLFDVASRIRAGESLHRDDEMVDQAAHAIKAALVLDAAPQPAPLTDDQVAEEWFEVYALPISPRDRAILFARAIERAHGIGSRP